jgi:hypothetical protein
MAWAYAAPVYLFCSLELLGIISCRLRITNWEGESRQAKEGWCRLYGSLSLVAYSLTPIAYGIQGACHG